MPEHGLMTAFPPTEDGLVTLANWRTPPFNRWSFQHVSEIVPTAPIWRGTGPVWQFPRAAEDLSSIAFPDHGGREISVGQFLDRSSTDGFMVLHRGHIVTEQYRNGLAAQRPHILMSVSKSITALVAGNLVEQRLLDPTEPITHLIPEAKGSAYDHCSLQHILDMTVGIDFNEDYLANGGAIVEYREASGWRPPSDPANPGDMRSWLLRLKKQGEHGAKFHYTSPCTDILGWALERASGISYAELVSRELWQKLGAEFDSYVTVDRFGAARAAGGVCLTLRDLARVGQMMLENGQANGRQVVPVSWVADTRFNGDAAAFRAGGLISYMPDGAYRNKWWVMNDAHGAYTGIGVYGQWLWIDPAANLVIAKFSSLPLPSDESADGDHVRCFSAIGHAMA